MYSRLINIMQDRITKSVGVIRSFIRVAELKYLETT